METLHSFFSTITMMLAGLIGMTTVTQVPITPPVTKHRQVVPLVVTSSTTTFIAQDGVASGTTTNKTLVKYEVINGISVPPEPDPKINNATLAGVDVNNNGVRDDVERQVARSSQSPASLNSAIKYEYILQRVAKSKFALTQAEAETHYKELVCAFQNIDNSLTTEQLDSFFANTSKRKDILQDAYDKVGFVDDSEISKCE